MFRNTLLVMLRNLARQKGYSFINIAGLALGVAATILILLVVQFELSFDTMHPDADLIYRVNSNTSMGGRAGKLAVSPAALGPRLHETIAELGDVARVTEMGRVGVLRDNRATYAEHQAIGVDPEVLSMFAIKLVAGDPSTALDNPNSLLITERFARQAFGDIPEIGTQVELTDNALYTITGILTDPPENTMFQADMMISLSTMPEAFQQNWGSMNCVTWVKLLPGTDPVEVGNKAQGIMMDQMGEAFERLGLTWEMFLYPMLDIHLHSAILGDPDTNIPLMYVVGFSAIAGFILLLACINFVNLSTARSSRRALEVGVRKVMGANRRELVRQFLGESTMYALISVLLAVLIVLAVLPGFKTIVQRQVSAAQLMTPEMLLGLLAIVLVVGLVSGSFPAFFLSAFKPIQVLKQGQARGVRGNLVRRILVVGQFVVSIALILGTVTTYRQIQFLAHQDLGFNRNELMTLWPNRRLDTEKLLSLKEALLRLPDVQLTTLSDSSPFGRSASKTVFEPDGAEGDEKLEAWIYHVDPDFIPTFGMTILQGRDFDPDLATDNGGSVILNEAAAKSITWTDDILKGQLPVPQRHLADSSPFKKPVTDRPVNEVDAEEEEENAVPANIIGVVKDFNFLDLHSPVEPVVFMLNTDEASHLALRVSTTDVARTRDAVLRTWEEYFPDEKVELRFVDDSVNRILRADRLFGNMIGAFTVLAMTIAMLGLFGLVSHTAEARTKELGVRKVLGASEPSLVLLLTREFTNLVLIASLLAVPLGIWLMNRWLEDFAMRIQVGVGIVAASVLSSLVLAWLSVAWQAIRAARRNPVESLRYE